ncbi:unnamed protein product [Mytilus coruscus]|uniref:Uncharacterized protein n=1 Tax=Mytilus coruscus TaxID=42192 RepID=A0A6J8AM01_MYTCO|nr:unnamed protein product [Mytilus coruscus]
MSKRCKIVDPELPSTSSISADFDWKECIFCQEQTKENLQCPANSKRSDLEVGTGYKTLETILERCQLIDWFPIPIRLENFTEENGLALNLQLHNAKWHKACRNKFSELKIERHEKQNRKGESGEQVGTTSKITRQSVGSATMIMIKDCFFCIESSGDLHKASTFEIDKHRENLKPLPENYTIVPPVVLPKEPAEIPTVRGPMISSGTEIPSALNLEYRWLDHVNNKIEADDIEDKEYS